MREFAPGEAKTAVAPITMSPSGLSCQAEIFLGPDETTKVVTSGRIPFTSTGVSQNIRLPIDMPAAEGSYHVYIDVYAEGLLVAAYQALEDVVIEPAIVWGTGIPTAEERAYAIEYGRQKLREYGWLPGGALTGEQWGEVYKYINPLAARYDADFKREMGELLAATRYSELAAQYEELRVLFNRYSSETPPLSAGALAAGCYYSEVHVAVICETLYMQMHNLHLQRESLYWTAFYSIQWKIEAMNGMYAEVSVL